MSGSALNRPLKQSGTGHRIRLARSAAGLSLRELSAKMRGLVSAQSISKYERGGAIPSSTVLLALVSALGVSVDYLFGGRDIVLDSIEYRKKSITSKRELARVEANVLHLLERYLTVEEVLDLPSLDWNKPREAQSPVRNQHELADLAAARLRDYWKLGLDPIPCLVELLEENGIKVLSFHLESVDGLTASVHVPGGRKDHVVVVNDSIHGERQRFTLAHELGHLVMDVPDDINKEKAANRFAGAFLMPEEALWREVGKHRSSIGGKELFYLKKIFGVSVQAIVYRCMELEILSGPVCRRLFVKFGKLGWRSPPYEPHPLPPETPTRYKRLVYRALSENAISDSKAAELLDLPVKMIAKMMQVPPYDGPEFPMENSCDR